MEKSDNNISSIKWITMSEASRMVPYSAEYLSLLARKKKISAKKVNDIWYTTESTLHEYVNRQILRNHATEHKTETNRMSYLPDRQAGIHLDVRHPKLTNSIDESEIKNKIKSKFQHGLISDSDKAKRAANIKMFVDTFHGQNNTEKKSHEPNNEILNQINQLSSSVKVLAEKIEPKISPPTQPNQMEAFFDKFNNYLDVSTESHFGIFHKIWRGIKNAFKYVFKKPKLLTITILLLAATIILPMRFVFGFFDDALSSAYNTMKDAQTVLGFRPGTHANELLLLDKYGNASIMGHIETEGQFRSFVKDGVAPIFVESKTLVKNLNSDYLDNLSAEQFTLAFVTKNGNVTTEDVYLEGKVEVGKYLLVKGAAKLLSSLEVDGELGVFGDVYLHKSLTVDGPTYLKALLSAQNIIAKDISAQNVSVENLTANKNIEGQDITARNNVTAEHLIAKQTLQVDGNASIAGQSVFGGFAMFNSGLQARTGDFEWSLGTGGDFSVGGNFSLGNGIKKGEANTQNWYITQGGKASFTSASISGTSTITNLTTSVASTTRLSVSDYFWSNGTTEIGNSSTDSLIINSGAISFTNSATATVASTSPSAFSFATSTTATPIFNIDALNGEVDLMLLNVTSTSATSTFANGIQLNGGCFMLVDGSCAGTGTITAGGGGSLGQVSFWTSATEISGDDGLFWNNTTKKLGIGTTSPSQALSVQGNGLFSGDVTLANLISTGTLNVLGTGTSTFAGGLSLGGGNVNIPINGAYMISDNLILNTTTLGSSVINSSLQTLGTITNGTWQGSKINPTYGGTGQDSYSQGDVLYSDSVNSLSKLPIGSPGQVLMTSNGIPTWAATSSAISSVSNADGTLTISPITGAVVASLNLGNPNTWTALQQFNNASSTLFSAQDGIYIGSTATTSLFGNGATSTFTNGISLSNGCFRMPNGTCVGGGTITASGGGGSAGQVAFWTNSTDIAGDSGLFWDNTNKKFGIGTTTPSQALSVQGDGLFSGDLSIAGLTATGTINLTGVNTAGATRCLSITTDGVVQTASADCGVSTGSNSSPWSTTTSQVSGELINYPNNSSDIVVIGSDASTTAKWFYDPNIEQGLLTGKFGIGTTSPSQALSVHGNGLLSGDLTLANLIATGTLTIQGSATSTFGGGLSLSSGNINLSSTGAYLISNSRILDSTTLGSSVINSSLQTLGIINSGTWQASVINPAYGGTGQSTYTKGDVLYSDAANSLSKLSIGLYGNILSVSGSGVPTWSATNTLGIAISDTTGVLTVARGGTNASSFASSMLVASDYLGTTLISTSTPTAANYLATSTTATSTFAGGFSAASSLYVLQNGNVGIGTASPEKKLHIKGDTTSSDLVFETSGYATKGYFAHYQGATAQFAINRSIQGVFSNTNAAAASMNFVGLSNNSYISFYTSPTNNTLPLERLTIDKNGLVTIAQNLVVSGTGNTTIAGKVGINETTPDAMLEIVTNATTEEGLKVKGSASQTGSLFNLVDSADNIFVTSGKGLAGGEFVINENSVDYDFRVESDGNTHALFVEGSSGYVGIGTTSPSQLLSVHGNGLISGNLSVAGLTATGTVLSNTIQGLSGTGATFYPHASLTTAYVRANAINGNYLGLGGGGGEISIGGAQQGYFSIYAPTGGTNPSTISFSNVTAGGAHEIKIIEKVADQPISDLQIQSQNAYASAATNLVGGNVLLVGGTGASGSGGAAHGGNILLDGGQGYGTGHNGYVLLGTSRTSNVGIGTTSPWGLLSVNSNGIGSAPQFVVGSSTKTDFVINNTGNVGIGTTSPFAQFSITGRGSTATNENSTVFAVYGNQSGEMVGEHIRMIAGTGGSTLDGGTITLTGGKAGDVVGLLTAGVGGAVSITAGAGGNGGLGSTNGDGGALFLSGGAAGTGGTNGGTPGNVLLGVTSDGTIRGNIGIGTSSPEYRLDVYQVVVGDTNASLASSRVLNVSNNQSVFDTTDEGLLAYAGYFSSTATRSAGANALTNIGLYATASGAQNNYAAIFENGNVGIGTATPTDLLSLGSGSNTATTSLSIRGGLNIAGADAILKLLEGSGSAGFELQYDGNLNNFNILSDNAGGTRNERLTIARDTGKVGIGTTSPSQRLSVHGNGLFSGDVSLANLIATGTLTLSGIGKNMLLTSDANGAIVSSSTPTAANYLATSTTATSTFAGGFVAGNGSLNVLQNGNVGIGTTSPASKLTLHKGLFTATEGDPVKVGSAQASSTINKLVVVGDYAYAVSSATGHDFEIFNISNPIAPVKVSGIDFSSLDNSPGAAQAIAISGNYAYIGEGAIDTSSNRRLRVVDISNPTAPVQVSSILVGSNTDNILDLAISGNHLYAVTTIPFGAKNLRVYDITNPTLLVRVGSVNVSNLNQPSAVAVSGNYAYVGSVSNSDDFEVIDISNPTAPIKIGGVELGNTYAVAVSGKYAYVGVVGDFRILDISNPAVPVQLSSISVRSGGSFDSVTDIKVSGRYAYVTSLHTAVGLNHFTVFDITDPTAPVKVGSYDFAVATGPLAVAVSGNYAYLGTSHTTEQLQIFELAGMRSPTGEIGILLADTIQAKQSLRVTGNTYLDTGLKVGGNANIGGALTITGTASSTLLSTNTNPALLVLSGNVGIGTTSPWGLLSVNANGIGSAPQFVVGSSTKTNFIITNAGDIGIGTTNPGATLDIIASSSTAVPLRVKGAASQSADLFKITDSSAVDLLTLNSSGNTMQFKSQATTIKIAQDGSGVGKALSVYGGAGYGTGNNGGGAVTVQGGAANGLAFGGAVAINGGTGLGGGSVTLQGANALAVGGSVTINSGYSTGASFAGNIALTAGYSTGADGGSITLTAGASSGSGTAGSVKFQAGIGGTTNGSIVFNDAGNDTDLRIEGDTNANLFYVDASADNIGIASSTPWRTLSVTGTVGFSSTLGTESGSDNYLCIDPVNYDITDGGANCAASSLRYKKDIESVPYGLAEVLELNPVSFYWNEAAGRPNDTTKHIGFIAEDMFNIVPEIVELNKDNQPESIEYDKLTSVIVKAIQELNTKIETLTVSASSTESALVSLDNRANSIEFALGDLISTSAAPLGDSVTKLQEFADEPSPLMAYILSEVYGQVEKIIDEKITKYFTDYCSTHLEAKLPSGCGSIAGNTIDGAISTIGDFGNLATEWFQSMGVEIAQGFLKVRDLVAETLFVDKATIAEVNSNLVNSDQLIVNSKATIGSAEQRIGITIFDRLTGEPQCVFSEGGILKQEVGECAVNAIANIDTSAGTADALTIPASPVSPTGGPAGGPDASQGGPDSGTTLSTGASTTSTPTLDTSTSSIDTFPSTSATSTLEIPTDLPADTATITPPSDSIPTLDSTSVVEPAVEPIVDITSAPI